jgi:microcystin-dependent protein
MRQKGALPVGPAHRGRASEFAPVQFVITARRHDRPALLGPLAGAANIPFAIRKFYCIQCPNDPEGAQMSEPFMGGLRLFSFNFAPKGWAMANGQFLPINQNQALFSLLGTMYGGNGQTTFALPDLRGRVPIHMGNGHTEGEAAGSESVTLNIQQLPQHLHFLQASSANADNINPGNNQFAAFNAGYTAPNNLVGLTPATVTAIGGSQPHTNQQPYLVLNFGIALQGIFPSQN